MWKIDWHFIKQFINQTMKIIIMLMNELVAVQQLTAHKNIESND